MKRFLVITGEGGSAGFRAAGFESVEVKGAQEAAELLMRLTEEEKCGLIAVEEKLLLGVPETVMRRIRRKGLPVVMHINIPGKWEERGVGESPVVRLIRRAIGYQIKIKR